MTNDLQDQDRTFGAVFIVMDQAGQPIPFARIEIAVAGKTVFGGLCDARGRMIVRERRRGTDESKEPLEHR